MLVWPVFIVCVYYENCSNQHIKFFPCCLVTQETSHCKWYTLVPRPPPSVFLACVHYAVQQWKSIAHYNERELKNKTRRLWTRVEVVYMHADTPYHFMTYGLQILGTEGVWTYMLTGCACITNFPSPEIREPARSTKHQNTLWTLLLKNSECMLATIHSMHTMPN